ncbi:MAG: zinc-binding dehydrogenase, partial [Chloroflexi bacterium]|nr:zinc-binding dehydrogenase [Chloroflexota bacterium]
KLGDRVARGARPRPGENPDVPSALPIRYTARQKGFGDLERPGAYAEYMEIDASRVVPIPEGVSDLAAALAEPLAVAVHAVRLTGIKLGDTALVMGAGPIGLFAMQCLRLSGAGAVYVSEPAAARADLARRLGADRVFNPRQEKVTETMLRLTDGIGPDVVLDAAGASPTLQLALETVRQRGRAVVVALCMEASPITTVDWVGREVELKAAYGSTPRDWQASFHLLRRHLVEAEGIVTDKVHLADIQAAFQALLKPTTQVQGVVML